MRCPHCNNKVLQKSGSITKLRTDGPVEFRDDGTCRTKCFWCKAQVELPLELAAGVDVGEERFVIRKG